MSSICSVLLLSHATHVQLFTLNLEDVPRAARLPTEIVV